MKALLSTILLSLPTVAIAAPVDASGLLGLVVQIVIAGLIFWLLLWLIGFAGLPEPFAKVAKIILAVVAVVFVINLLLGLTGSGPIFTFR